MAQELTAERLRELLRYDPKTGFFTWLVSTNRRIKIGTVAGTNIRGHIRIKVGGLCHGAGRLAWLYMTGDWPHGEVDHKNGVRNDNVFSNLRDVTPSMNRQNQRFPHSRNVTGGLLGVSRAKTVSVRFRARINNTYLGLFKTAEEAHQAYVAAKRVVHPGGML